MVKLVVKFKKRGQGGLAGKTETHTFRTVAEAKRFKSFLRRTYTSAKIIARKKRRRAGFRLIGF